MLDLISYGKQTDVDSSFRLTFCNFQLRTISPRINLVDLGSCSQHCTSRRLCPELSESCIATRSPYRCSK